MQQLFEPRERDSKEPQLIEYSPQLLVQPVKINAVTRHADEREKLLHGKLGVDDVVRCRYATCNELANLLAAHGLELGKLCLRGVVSFHNHASILTLSFVPCNDPVDSLPDLWHEILGHPRLEVFISFLLHLRAERRGASSVALTLTLNQRDRFLGTDVRT